jgi:hypothetical protein
MAIVGGAVLTPAMGLLSVRFGCMAIAYIVPAFAYIFIAFYIFSRICAYSALNHPGAIHRERDSESARRGQRRLSHRSGCANPSLDSEVRRGF